MSQSHPNRRLANFLVEVERGNIPGHSIWRALGERERTGNTATGEDVWRGNELSPSPTSHTIIPTPSSSGEAMEIVSESANDTLSGTGVQKVRLHLILANGTEVTEDKDMNGTTAVALANTDVRFVNDMYAIQTGSVGVADDHIKVRQVADNGLVYNMIAGGGNKSLVPLRMVPAGHTLTVFGWSCSEARGRRCAFRLRSTDMFGELLEGVFCFKDVQYLRQATSGWVETYFSAPALSIVKVSVWPDQIFAEVGVSWSGLLSKNN